MMSDFKVSHLHAMFCDWLQTTHIEMYNVNWFKRPALHLIGESHSNNIDCVDWFTWNYVDTWGLTSLSYITCYEWFACAILRVSNDSNNSHGHALCKLVQMIGASHSNCIVCVAWFTEHMRTCLEPSIRIRFESYMNLIWIIHENLLWICHENLICILYEHNFEWLIYMKVALNKCDNWLSLSVFGRVTIFDSFKYPTINMSIHNTTMSQLM